MRCVYVILFFFVHVSYLRTAPVPKTAADSINYFPAQFGAKWVYQIEGSDKEIVNIVSDVKSESQEIIVTVRGGDKEKSPIVHVMSISSKGLFQLQETVFKIDPPLCLLALPHKDRASWEYEVALDKTTHKGIQVAFGPEKVKVLAGTYDAIRVETSFVTDGKSRKKTSWYAPDVGLVKSESADIVCVLKSFAPGKK